jgi:hypothetical protein
MATGTKRWDNSTINGGCGQCQAARGSHIDLVYVTCDSFDEWRDIFSAVDDILNTIEKSTFDRVFLEWIDRLPRYIDTNGDYAEYTKRNVLSSSTFDRHISRVSPGDGTH